VLQIQDLHATYGAGEVLFGVSMEVKEDEVVCLLGRNGVGKSTTLKAIMGLVKSPPGRIESGEILFHRDGSIIDLVKLNPKGEEMRRIRGNEIAMIFQEPMTSLNPVYTIGNQIMEAIILHQRLSKKEAKKKAIEVLASVGIPSPEQRVDEYPHQLSGGMRQRAMIAMALSCHPSLLIADEPTTALDVTIQAQVQDLMNDLRTEFKAAIMFITHDLGVIAHMADDVIIMYLGRIVESAPVGKLFDNPKHPYTIGLLNSIPSFTVSRKKRLVPIEGIVPDSVGAPRGCGFEPRCPQAKEICKSQIPELKAITTEHLAACWLYH